MSDPLCRRLKTKTKRNKKSRNQKFTSSSRRKSPNLCKRFLATKNHKRRNQTSSKILRATEIESERMRMKASMINKGVPLPEDSNLNSRRIPKIFLFAASLSVTQSASSSLSYRVSHLVERTFLRTQSGSQSPSRVSCSLSRAPSMMRRRSATNS